MKVGVLSREDLHQQPAQLEIPERVEAPERVVVERPDSVEMPERERNVWVVKLDNLYKKERDYQSQRNTVQEKFNIFISRIRFHLKVPKDISDEVMMGTIEEYIILRSIVVEWFDLVKNITCIVRICNLNREDLEVWAAFLKNGSAEACEQLEVLRRQVQILRSSVNPESLANGAKDVQIACIERERHHIESYCEHVCPLLENSRREVASALVKNSNLKYRLDQMKAMNKCSSRFVISFANFVFQSH